MACKEVQVRGKSRQPERAAVFFLGGVPRSAAAGKRPNPSVNIGLHAAHRFKLDVQPSMARSRAMVSARPGVYAWYIAQRRNDQAPFRGLTQTGLSLTPAG
jgi:hypothetical protein